MKENEKIFLSLVKKGVFKVYKNGNVCKHKKKDYSNKYREYKSILMNKKTSIDYIRLYIYYQKKYFCILAHRLIWIYFNGEISEGLEINHKNGIKDDNRLSNLELTTRNENMIHAYKNKLEKITFGENSNNHKLKNKDVLKIRKLLKEGVFQKEIAKMFNVTRSNISAIAVGKTWS